MNTQTIQADKAAIAEEFQRTGKVLRELLEEKALLHNQTLHRSVRTIARELQNNSSGWEFPEEIIKGGCPKHVSAAVEEAGLELSSQIAADIAHDSYQRITNPKEGALSAADYCGASAAERLMGEFRETLVEELLKIAEGINDGYYSADSKFDFDISHIPSLAFDAGQLSIKVARMIEDHPEEYEAAGQAFKDFEEAGGFDYAKEDAGEDEEGEDEEGEEESA